MPLADAVIPMAEPEGLPSPALELVLVVEDDVALLRLIERRLAESGLETHGVRDGAAALAYLDHRWPRLMLLDYSLPDMRGEELVERVRATGNPLAFVVATGHGNESVAVEMMKRGAFDYVVKNAAFLELLPTVVRRALEQARGAERLRKTEEKLHRAYEQLETRVHRRTAELAEANRRLRVEIDERRRAEERAQQHQAELAHVSRLSTVGEMVAELAHELNQPLSAISGYSQACKRLLEPGAPAAEADGATSFKDLMFALTQISEQTNRAAEIIRRIRRFVAKTKPMQVPLDMNVVVREVAALMAIDAWRLGAEIALDLAPGLPPVVGDRVQLEQVVVNLMRNGLEAMRDARTERRQLTVRTFVDDNRVAVDVQDTGGGIRADVAAQIFDRFFTTKADGMGLGLAISRSIIESHEGRLWVASATDHGATLRFTLPIDPGEHNRGH